MTGEEENSIFIGFHLSRYLLQYLRLFSEVFFPEQPQRLQAFFDNEIIASNNNFNTWISKPAPQNKIQA